MAAEKTGDMTTFDSIEDAIVDIGAGRMVVVVDDEDRENEGDLIFAAARATPRHIGSWCAIARASSAFRWKGLVSRSSISR